MKTLADRRKKVPAKGLTIIRNVARDNRRCYRPDPSIERVDCASSSMFLKDLGEYKYNNRFVLPGVQSVGWLVVGAPFRTGTLPSEVVEKLKWLAALRPVNQMRGFHRCELCTRAKPQIEVEGVVRVLGSAEIWVPGHVELFAAPDLIIHYIQDHQYMPPAVFVDAVKSVDLRTWQPPRDYGLALCRKVLQQR